jgi:hypothetical protein
VQRHALASELPDRLAAAGIEVVHVVANPASYLYPDDRRPDGSGGFARPAGADAGCAGWNRYKYGLEEPNAYLAGTSRGCLLDRLRRRRFVYLLGIADDDPAHPELDTSCAARLQGRHRLDHGDLPRSARAIGWGWSGGWRRRTVQRVCSYNERGGPTSVRVREEAG